MQKEPKLARARAIPEWEEYDGEIAALTRRLADAGKLRSPLTAADVNALAGEPAARAEAEETPAEEPAAAESTGEGRKHEEL